MFCVNECLMELYVVLPRIKEAIVDWERAILVMLYKGMDGRKYS